jgi:modulator of FtsH protease HflK
MAGFGNRNGGDDDGFSPEHLARLGSRVVQVLGSRLLTVIVLGLLLITAWASYYQIQPEEVGLITRFGAYTGTSQPGPHFKLPFAERVFRVPVKRQLKEEFGFRTQRAAVRSEYEDDSGATDLESRMLSGDLNIADVEWIVQYRIADAYKYVFNVRGMGETLRDMAESSMRKVVGDHSVSEILTIGREAIQMRAKQELQAMCDRYGTGIHIEQLVLQDVNPPKPVRESFNEVNQAIQERQRAVNQAWARYNSVIPKARGSALQTVQTSEGYATERVNRARGEVARFLSLQQEYAKAPAVTRTRLYLETMGEVLPRAQNRIFIDDRLKGLLPLFPLDGGNRSGLPAAGSASGAAADRGQP